jgi:hypothetical protein
MLGSVTFTLLEVLLDDAEILSASTNRETIVATIDKDGSENYSFHIACSVASTSF